MSTQMHNKMGYGNTSLSGLLNILYLFHFCLQYTALMFATIAGQSELVSDYSKSLFVSIKL